MNRIWIMLFGALIFSCSEKTELDFVVDKNPKLKVLVDSLKFTPFIYNKCKECHLIGLTEDKLIGYSDRYPPKGNYDKKEIEIGSFDYDVFSVLDYKDDKRIIGKIYFCYFSTEQRISFKNFSHYYRNLIMHGKSTFQVTYNENIALIKITYGG